MKKIQVKLGAAPYSVLVGHGMLRETGRHVKKLLPAHESLCLVVTSKRVRGLWGKVLEDSLRKAALKFVVVEVSDSESAKQLAESTWFSRS